MAAKIRELLEKLEFGFLELILGFLMIIGLVGYFGSLPADLDWIDHTISFLMFSYFFYILNITSILFGQSNKIANVLIVMSYFALFFKDILSYTAVSAANFKVLKFIGSYYAFFESRIALSNIITFYIGIVGIGVVSIYLARKISISRPSILYAIGGVQFKNSFVKFFAIFLGFLSFYYLVYSPISEWLEFVLDDPIILVGIIYFAVIVAKHHHKFHEKHVVFKIGDLVWGWYRRFILIFQYKKTLALGISGLLILHALSDLGVFAYSYIFSRENFYLEFLRYEHVPFLSLFINDVKNLNSFIAVPLFIVYILNALSMVVFLLIPVVVWAALFSQKKLHFNRIFLFLIYSSTIAYLLMPAYIIEPITRLSIKGGLIGEDKTISGVDIRTISLLDGSSILDKQIPEKSNGIIAASLISLVSGLIAYILGSIQKVKRELYAFSIIGGLVFYALYIFYFFISLLSFYSTALTYLVSPHFLIGIVLAIFLALSIFFYIGGYLMFLYEIVMEFHKRKWSEQIDEEIVAAIGKIKRAEAKIKGRKRAQVIGEMFKYGLVAVFSIFILIVGYKVINAARESACKAELARFEIDMRDLDQDLRFGTKELRSYDVPCKVDEIYFFDLGKAINYDNFERIPILKDALQDKNNHNVFLVKKGAVQKSFYAGKMEMVYPYHICFLPKFDGISFYAEGAGKSIKVASSCDQPECTYIPINISEDDMITILREAIDFNCLPCPNDIDEELPNIQITRQNVEMLRKFHFCEGITEVQIILRPKKGTQIKNFTFLEFLPKACIENLNAYLAENIQGNVEIRSDPLIMWHFDDLGQETRISYKLSTNLDEICRDAIKGLGVAHFIEGQEDLLNEQQPGPFQVNTPPTMGNINDVVVSGIRLHKNVVTNVWKFAQDAETDSKDLSYSIISQTNPDFVDCNINGQNHVDCDVRQNVNAISRVTIQVDDGEFTNVAGFNVELSEECRLNARKTCVENQVFWLDSCGNVGNHYRDCDPGEECKDGECSSQCTPKFERRCGGKNMIYWYDSCGRRGAPIYNCSKHNLVRNQCSNGRCCIGDYLCQTPPDENGNGRDKD